MRFLILTMLGLWLSVSAIADDVPKELDNLVVSASRSPISRDQSGSSITVIDRAHLERRQSVLVLDLLRDVPGVAVSRSGTFGSTAQVRLRGAEANHVLVIIDGVEINDPSQGDAVDFAHLSAQNIERIEIVRGPQSALWGSDAIAGVISIVTREATDPFSLQGYAEGGSFSTAHGGLRLSGLGENYSYSANVSYLDTDGTNVSRTGGEDDAYDNLTADFKTAIALTDAWSANASIRRTVATSEFDPVDFFTTGLPTDGDRETDIGQTYAQLRIQLESQNWVHGWKLSFLDTNNENFADGILNTRQAAETLGVSYQANVVWSDQSMTFAIDYEEDDFIQRGTASPFGNPNQDQTTRSTGYVAEYRSQILESLNVSLSVRYDDNSDFDSIVTYRGAASYTLSDLTRFRVSIGTGQTRPTFTELFGFFPDQFIGNPNLDPERSFAWEIGVEQDFGPMTAELGYFNERLEDEIDGFVFDLDTFLFTAENRAGTSHREGIELSVGGNLTDWFALSASYTYTDSDEPDGAGGAQRELRRPRNRASLNLNFIPGTRSNLNLNVTHNGKQQDLFFPPFPAPSERLDLDSYTLVNLSGHFDFSETFRLVARVENLLDEEYEEIFGFRAPGIGVYTGVQFGIK